MKKNNLRAFTLIELAVVIVIVGLVISGIVTGMYMMRASQFKSQMNQINEFRSAYNIFAQKYRFPPGDFPNPYSKWPTLIAGYSSNGNGRIDCWSGTYSACAAPGVFSESALALSVLRELNLIKRTSFFNGNTYTGAIDNTVVYFIYKDVYDTGSPMGLGATYSINSTDLGDAITLARVNLPQVSGAVFTPQEAFELDRKYDDGIPNSGSIYGRPAYDLVTWPTNLICYLPATNSYNTAQTNQQCRMIFSVN